MPRGRSIQTPEVVWVKRSAEQFREMRSLFAAEADSRYIKFSRLVPLHLIFCGLALRNKSSGSLKTKRVISFLPISSSIPVHYPAKCTLFSSPHWLNAVSPWKDFIYSYRRQGTRYRQAARFSRLHDIKSRTVLSVFLLKVVCTWIYLLVSFVHCQDEDH